MRRALPIVLVLLAAAGCKKTLHWKFIEDEIAERIGSGLPAGVRVTSATCPETEVKIGLTFRCQVAISNGETGAVEVKLLDLQASHTLRPVD